MLKSIRKLWIFLLVVVACFAMNLATAQADTYVRGYYRSDGTYVRPHYRSSPDGSYNNNWSVYPNVNPYTGRQGTRSPAWNDRSPYNNRNHYQSGNGYGR